ncbi:MAG TPA: FAD-dependent oxidoreductase [Streptosporangiaceae bacterium]
MHTTDALIIGGGLAGCATACHLAADGVETTLVERGGLNRAASGTNAGSLHFQLRRHDQLWPARGQLIRGGLAEWRAIEAEFGAGIGIRRGGGLMVAETAAELARLRAKIEPERELGLTSQIVGGRELAELAPALARDLAGAAYCPEEGLVNPLLATGAFASAAAGHGADIRTGCEVRAVDVLDRGGFVVHTSDGPVRAARVVNAAGAWAGRVGRLARAPLPLTGRVQMVSATAREPPVLTQLVQHAARALTLKQTMDGTFLIGGGWAGAVRQGGPRTRWQSLAGNAFLACRVVPGLRTATLLRSWTGTIAVLPDRLPAAGESGRRRGWFSLVVPRGAAGYTVTPYLARLLAGDMATGSSAMPDAFSPDRWCCD